MNVTEEWHVGISAQLGGRRYADSACVESQAKQGCVSYSSSSIKAVFSVFRTFLTSSITQQHPRAFINQISTIFSIITRLFTKMCQQLHYRSYCNSCRRYETEVDDIRCVNSPPQYPVGACGSLAPYNAGDRCRECMTCIRWEINERRKNERAAKKGRGKK